MLLTLVAELETQLIIASELAFTPDFPLAPSGRVGSFIAMILPCRLPLIALAVLVSLSCPSWAIEKSVAPVAVSGQPAPGTTNGVKFSFASTGYFDVDNEGNVVFTAELTGPGVGATNRSGIWWGPPGNSGLVMRAGQAFDDGLRVGSFENVIAGGPNQIVFGFLPPAAGGVRPQAARRVRVGGALLRFPGLDESKFLAAMLYYDFLVRDEGRSSRLRPAAIVDAVSYAPLTQNGAWVASGVEILGEGIDPLNAYGIAVGSTNLLPLIAQGGSPAPDTGGTYTGLMTLWSLLSDGRVLFSAESTGVEGASVLFFGSEGTVEPVAVPGNPAPMSLLGPAFTYRDVASTGASANAQGEIAFAAFLSGPGVGPDNSEVIAAGDPAAPRLVARSGTPAPGTTESFQDFGKVVMGSEGQVLFQANLSASDLDFGLWLAPPNRPSLLVARTGSPAPGTPPGVVFQDLIAMNGPYLNRRGQGVFRAALTGPGVGPTNNVGIWLMKSDGQVELLARLGDTLDLGDGTRRELTELNWGVLEDLSISNGEDGRQSPFNDRCEVVLAAGWREGMNFSRGIFLMRLGVIATASVVGNNIEIRFPTELGHHYRVEKTPSFPVTQWTDAAPAVSGTGDPVTVLLELAPGAPEQLYRVSRID
ncbi:MAG TPA: hypothetical protein PLX89_11835 [Verrucomicrobiota bacterium]|nr:hypothetical protein [Verrucomicrobiales bacterium]HRI13682.1 hypothetical protein [Verrucomicrobiota bacterium]